jgi:hypothetical protein
MTGEPGTVIDQLVERHKAALKTKEQESADAQLALELSFDETTRTLRSHNAELEKAVRELRQKLDQR